MEEFAREIPIDLRSGEGCMKCWSHDRCPLLFSECECTSMPCKLGHNCGFQGIPSILWLQEATLHFECPFLRALLQISNFICVGVVRHQSQTQSSLPNMTGMPCDRGRNSCDLMVHVDVAIGVVFWIPLFERSIFIPLEVNQVPKAFPR